MLLILVSTLKKTEGPEVKLQNYAVFCVYALYIDTPWKGKGHQGTKAKQWNYTYFLHVPLKKIPGTKGKTTKLHCFVCMPYI